MTPAPEEVAPAASSGRRLNTQLPDKLLTITSDDLAAMSNEQLCKFADEMLGIPMSPSEPRTKILTRIANTAMGARDGT